MRVILEVISGSTAGRKVCLTADQELRVGRTEWADFAVPHDSRMSGVHFALQSDISGCYLTDLGSSNGTLVNGQPVSARTLLGAGDEILAGETRFAVHVEQELGVPPGGVGAAEARGQPGSVRPSSVGGSAPVPLRHVRFSTETCSSGLTLCRGTVEQLPPQDLAGLIARQISLYLIVDFRKLGMPPPSGAGQGSYLFSWLPTEAAAAVSPRIVAAGEMNEWPAVLADGWGSDAVVCLFSRQNKAELAAHLQDAARVKGKKGDASSGMLGFCWPSVMAMLLAYAQPGLVRRVLAGIEAVLVELPDLPDTWQVYGESPVAQLLEKIGLQPESGEARETP
jgi:hypothetical protein